MLLTITPGSSVALNEQLANGIRQLILSGELAPGTRLPPAKTLASSFSVNLHTVLRALHTLRDEGYLELARGRGATVTARGDALTQIRPLIRDLAATAKTQGVALSTLTSLIAQEYHS